MILPDDVLDIIRAYARPRMRFYQEFKETLEAFGRMDWPEVREKLGGTTAEPLIRALLDYTSAYFAVEEVKSMYTFAVHPFHQRFYSIELSRQIWNRDELESKLKVLLE